MNKLCLNPLLSKEKRKHVKYFDTLYDTKLFRKNKKWFQS